ncbi:MAG TPA: hypothetical protein V6D17_05315 [Candidatus Obscuribacterales bacterium]
MADKGKGEIDLAQIAKKIDEQGRFTRSVMIICTMAVLGLVLYTMTEMFSSLPSNIVLHLMGNLEKIIHEYHEIERVRAIRAARQNPPPPAPPKPAPNTPAPEPPKK